jgi:hypothetical protein
MRNDNKDNINNNFFELYKSLPIEMGGPIGKNRNRNEFLWGLNRVYEMSLNEDDFVIIFDNRCDIEIVKKESIIFYQLKTSNKNYTINEICKVPSDSKNSILSKLYSVNGDIVKAMYIVSNKRLSIEDAKVGNQEKFCFNELKQKETEKITKNIKEVLNVDVYCSKLYYWTSEFCITQPHKLLQGETVDFLKHKFNEDFMKPKYFFDYMQSLVMDKASYEKHCIKYEDVLEHKGLTSDQFNKILNNYDKSSDKFKEKIDIKLNNFPDYSEKIKLLTAFSELNKLGLNSILVENETKNILGQIDDNKKSFLKGSFADVVEKVYKAIIINTEIIDIYQKKILIIIALVRMEEKI